MTGDFTLLWSYRTLPCFLLLYGDILIDVLAADKCVVENVCKHTDNEPVAGYVADVERQYVVLDERHDATTYYEHHEDT